MTEKHDARGEGVDVDVRSFNGLFRSGDFALALDTYQRGFVWSDDKVEQLIKDLTEYQALSDPKPPYFMGTVLLHRSAEKERRFVIDGQQRLTALCVLYHRLKQALPPDCEMQYSPASARTIRAAAALCSEAAGALDPTLFDRIRFSVVCVDRLDLAFTFFDTQNNRGVPLDATDLLKAFHLRAIRGETVQQESLQTHCAQRWESLQESTPVMSPKQALVQTLFTRLLWRARRWTGKHAFEGGHDALLFDFQTKSVVANGAPHTVPLYRHRANRRALALTIGETGVGSLQTDELAPSSDDADLPFAIRQPVHRGLGFFLYTDKYAALLRRLMHDTTADRDIERLRDVDRRLIKYTSLFLREIFLLCVLCYADQFGSERLGEFSLWLEHALGMVRVQKDQVRQESAQKFFRSAPEANLLDLIAGAFDPGQVIDHLKSYRDDAYAAEKIDVSKNGVQATYKRAVLAFYKQPESSSLAARRKWLEEQSETKRQWN